MDMISNTIDQTAILERLRQPLDPPADGVFRLGLVLNGTVSAGAWTAGVLDFLIEALDRWEDQKEEDRRRGGTPTVPDHQVRIGVAGGASGGGVCAALLARAAGWQFPHVATSDSSSNHDNPFWRVWVEELDVAKMLGTEDLTGKGAIPVSLLSGKAIDAAGDVILGWPNRGAKALRRKWLADLLRVIVTLTNLRGVPYRIRLQGDACSYYVSHADYGMFTFSPNGQANQQVELRGDEHFVHTPEDWVQFAEFIKATGAFPGGFPPRRLTRPVSDYLWRGVALPGEQGKSPEIALLEPAWDALDPPINPTDDYTFDCVDGGALNNQPVELVRTALSGLGRSNDRDPKKADAAVLLIDPFATVPQCQPPKVTERRDLLGVLGGLFSAWEDHARFATSDLLLAVQPNVFSRFLLTASDIRGGKARHGGAALATNGLGAFMGFLGRQLRVHDYLLGRENCRTFLMKEFVLDDENPLFRDFARRWPDVSREYQPSDGHNESPIIPVVPPLRSPQPVPAWPANAVHPDALRKEIAERSGLVLHGLLENNGIDIPFDRLVIDTLLDSKIADAVENQIKKAVMDEGLG